MQYSLLTEVWGQNYHENKNIINAGQDNSLDDVAKNVDSAVTGAQDEADDNKEQKLLLSFRKNVIKPSLCCKAYNALEKEAQKKHHQLEKVKSG